MKYIDLESFEKDEVMFEQLKKGVFFTTKVDSKVNTMTIAWGGVSSLWNKSVFVAYVRYSRNSYDMLNSTNEFTINIPLNGQLRKELNFCGTKSGRDYNKIKECNLSLIKGRTINTPIIKECDLHYECKVIYRQAMEPNNIPERRIKRYYANNDFHCILYGEIVDSYF